MTDRFAAHSPSLSSPATSGFAVTPSDSVDLQETSRCLYVGTAGDINLTMSGGETLVFKNIPAGALMPLRVNRVLATGTTAAQIIALL